MKNIVVLTGAGMSAESGLKTFRDADGLWEGHDVMEVASPEAFERNPELVLEFYNQRRRQLLTVEPNDAHRALAKLEEHYRVQIVTQNVDDLHERAGSNHVLHLHGELLKARSVGNESTISIRREDILLGDLCEKGYQLRPHIVWFGEPVPMLDRAINITQNADILIIIGTSMQVYPAASLINFINDGTPIYFIDPRPSIQEGRIQNLKIIPKTAVEGVPILVDSLIDKAT
ncbi:SIR2 family NAD-dependent protein deacylase [Maribacter cobaltidurans]|uniref:NAD-dependent protein deacylase n=1 Tax=Maribacter cobaltidurans TaxID=1178778 RepID=A0A223V9I0_9FLAO|nr:NAD-dependent deacylase [Maribacter cobaltidurans]ASV31917.1 NAD-dependent protein deacylase [Maribacter cobaltidurans]GGD85637.1 NAD-dependent protein deacylase [Maribacter cobaltidurans]